MSLKPLFPLTQQFHGMDGENLVAGLLKVYLSDTDDTAETFSDATGETLNPSPIVLDNLGMAQVWVEPEKVYRLEVYHRSGALLYTRYPMYPMDGEGSGESTEVISTDGSIAIDKTQIGSTTQFDLSVAKDSAEYLEWARCSTARNPTSNVFYPIGDEGSTLFSDNTGIVLTADGLFHVTLKMRATKSVAVPFYDKVKILVKTDDGTVTSEQIELSALIDGSLGLSQEFEISGDVKTGSASTTRLFVTVEDTSVSGVSYEFVGMDIHRVFSGVPHVPGGIQGKLTAGQNITITPDNVISATGGGGGSVYKVLRASPDAEEIAQIVADAIALPERGSALVIGIYNSYDGTITWYHQTLFKLTSATTGMVGFSCCTPDYAGGSWGHAFFTAVFYADADSSQNYSRYMAGFANNVHTWDPWADYT